MERGSKKERLGRGREAERERDREREGVRNNERGKKKKIEKE